MFKSVFTVIFLIIIVACANNSGDKSTEQNNDQATSQQEEDPEAARGLELIAASDCLTCHKVSETLTGPSYEAVAAKYPINEEIIDTLSQRIIEGSQGIWGEVQMTPHPDLSKEDARAMVKYIMSIKN